MDETGHYWLFNRHNCHTRNFVHLTVIDNAYQLNSSIFGAIMQSKLVLTDVSGPPIGSIFKGPAVQEDGSTLKDGAER